MQPRSPARSTRANAGAGDNEPMQSPTFDSNDRKEDAPPIEALSRVDILARDAGMLPEFLASGKASRPAEHNPRHWLYRAVCLRMTWTEHDLVTPKAFDAAVEAVSDFPVR